MTEQELTDLQDDVNDLFIGEVYQRIQGLFYKHNIDNREDYLVYRDVLKSKVEEIAVMGYLSLTQ